MENETENVLARIDSGKSPSRRPWNWGRARTTSQGDWPAR